MVNKRSFIRERATEHYDANFIRNISVRLDLMSKVVDNLCRFTGMPLRLKNIVVCSSPATASGKHVEHDNLRGYMVEIREFSADYTSVTFSTTYSALKNEDDDIVQAVILDSGSNVESVCKASLKNNGLCTLPITKDSVSLWVTIPYNSSNATLNIPEYVELRGAGLSNKIESLADATANAVLDLKSDIEEIEKSLEMV